MKKAFIFDMDGTIVDNMAYHTAAWVAFFGRRGRLLDEEEFFLRTTGRISSEILREFVSADLSDAECAALVLEKELLYRELYGPHRKTLTGFDSFQATARGHGMALAVGTAANECNIVFTLDGLALRDHFDTVVGAGDVKRGKPDPDVFLMAAQRCGVAPGDCIVFEDAPLGVEAARRAGMRAVALTTTMPASAFAGFDNVIAIAANYMDISIEDLFALPAPATGTRAACS